MGMAPSNSNFSISANTDRFGTPDTILSWETPGQEERIIITCVLSLRIVLCVIESSICPISRRMGGCSYRKLSDGLQSAFGSTSTMRKET